MVDEYKAMKVKEVVRDCWFSNKGPQDCHERSMFLPGHIERLAALPRYCAGCDDEIKIVGEYVVATLYESTTLGGRSGERLNELKYTLSENIRLLGALLNRVTPGPWLLDAFTRAVNNALDSLSVRGVLNAAVTAVIGVDRPTGKLFVHVLPPSLSTLGILCGALKHERPLRALMGFDYNPWEYSGGLGRLRVQGDLVLEVLREYDGGLGEVFTDTVAAMSTTSALQGLFSSVEYTVKARVQEALSRLDPGPEGVEEAIAAAVFRASEDILGVSIGVPAVSRAPLPGPEDEAADLEAYIVDYDVYFVEEWVDPVNPSYLEESAVLEYVKKAFSIVNADRLLYRPSKAPGASTAPRGLNPRYYKALAGGLEGYEAPRPSMLDLIVGDRRVIVDVTRPVNLIYAIAGSILIEEFWSRDGEGRLLACTDPARLERIPVPLRGIVGRICRLYEASRISIVRVGNHSVDTGGYRVTGTSYAYGVLLEEAEALVRRIYYFSETLPRRNCTLEVLDALSRVFAAKRGEELVLLRGYVHTRHPEHGSTSIYFTKPVLARITTMNNWNVMARGRRRGRWFTP